GHDVVEVVAVDLDELAVLEGLEGLGGVAGEVAQDADDERQLLFDDRPLGLDLVGDVDPGLADPVQLVMDAGTHGIKPPHVVGKKFPSAQRPGGPAAGRWLSITYSTGASAPRMPTCLKSCCREVSSGMSSDSNSGSGIRPQRTACSRA